MITPTADILKEVIEDIDELIDYVLSSSGDPNLPKWLLELKEKIVVVYGRLSSPVVQQLSRNNDDYAFMAQSEDI